MYQIGFILLGLLGLIGLAVSLMWIIHIVIYMLPPVPIHPMLNEVFMKLDGVFPLFGVAAFAAFCCYLMGEPGDCVRTLCHPACPHHQGEDKASESINHPNIPTKTTQSKPTPMQNHTQSWPSRATSSWV